MKVLATDSEDRILGEASCDYPVFYPQEKWAEQDPADWWSGTVYAIRSVIENCRIQPDQVAAIGLSGQMHGLVALDRNNRVLFPALIWCDQRSDKEAEEINQHFGKSLLSEHTGNKALTGFTATKLLWLKKNHNEIFSQIHHILLPKDYIRYRLTGDYVTDYSDASGTLLLDVRNKRWSEAMCSYIGIDVSALPKLVESYEISGWLSNQAKHELGLVGPILVAGGAGDQAAGAVGSGTVRDGDVLISLGTSGVVFINHEAFKSDPDCRLHAFCNASGSYHSMGVMLSAASCLDWWSNTCGDNTGIEELLKEAETLTDESKIIFLPYLMGERTPYPDPDAMACFLGMNMKTKRGHLTRSVLEGVSFGLKDSLEIIREMGQSIKQVRVIGGGSRSDFWKKILADILDVELEEINTNQGASLGAAILAAVAAGHYSSIEDACSRLIQVNRIFKPDPAKRATYRKKYMSYKNAYPILKNWFRSL